MDFENFCLRWFLIFVLMIFFFCFRTMRKFENLDEGRMIEFCK